MTSHGAHKLDEILEALLIPFLIINVVDKKANIYGFFVNVSSTPFRKGVRLIFNIEVHLFTFMDISAGLATPRFTCNIKPFNFGTVPM